MSDNKNNPRVLGAQILQNAFKERDLVEEVLASNFPQMNASIEAFNLFDGVQYWDDYVAFCKEKMRHTIGYPVYDSAILRSKLAQAREKYLQTGNWYEDNPTEYEVQLDKFRCYEKDVYFEKLSQIKKMIAKDYRNYQVPINPYLDYQTAKSIVIDCVEQVLSGSGFFLVRKFSTKYFLVFSKVLAGNLHLAVMISIEGLKSVFKGGLRGDTHMFLEIFDPETQPRGLANYQNKKSIDFSSLFLLRFFPSHPIYSIFYSRQGFEENIRDQLTMFRGVVGDIERSAREVVL